MDNTDISRHELMVRKIRRDNLVSATCDCGIDPKGKTPKQVRKAFGVLKDKKFVDQFDVRLDQALKALGA